MIFMRLSQREEERPSIFSGISAFALLIVANVSAIQAAEPIAELKLVEHFGVNHPEQIVRFPADQVLTSSAFHVIDESDKVVPSQKLNDGRVAVRSNLTSGQQRIWRVMPGKAITPKTDLHLEKLKDRYRLSNGHVAIEIPRASKSRGTKLMPAPVQGLRLADGTWTARAQNTVKLQSGVFTRMSVDVVERGPLVAQVVLHYEVDRPDFRADNGKNFIPGGRGFYRCTITLEANEPVVNFEEDSDCDVIYSFSLAGLNADQARYRGHHSRKVEHGRMADGSAYAMQGRPAADAIFDLPFHADHQSSYVTILGKDKPGIIRWMARWDPWMFDSGWYWQFYNKDADDNSNFAGIFAGPASRLIGPAFASTGVYTRAATKDTSRHIGLTMQLWRRSANATIYPRVRFGWNLMIGKKSDVADPLAIQPIARKMNQHSGFNLTKLAFWKLNFPDPPQGYGGLYMDKEAVEHIKQLVREDKQGPHGQGYYGWLYRAESYSRAMFDMWRDKTGAKFNAAVDKLMTDARECLHALVNEDGIYSRRVHYWHGGLMMQRNGVWIDQLLGDERITPEQRAKVKAASAMFGYILWDNDFVPMNNHRGINLGTANMPVQQSGYRRFYALLLANHADFYRRAAETKSTSLSATQRIVNEHGAQMGCPHYLQASMAPTINSLMQIKQVGLGDAFADEPRLSKFARFYMNMLTPPEPRLKGHRSVIVLGDGAIENSALFGQLGTGFRDANPKLSAQLMQAWDSNGRPHSFFFGSTTVMIDDRLPRADMALGDGRFEGYYTVLRNAYNTPDETAVWLVDGDYYRDHRHPSDRGSIIAYALGQPLVTQWSGIYSPYVPGGYFKPAVMLESMIGQPWDQDSPGVRIGGEWKRSKHEAFHAFEEGAYARVRCDYKKTTWRRELTVIRANPKLPIIVLKDTFKGAAKDEAKVMTLTLEAQGAVVTPKGEVTPPVRKHPQKQYPGHVVPPGELPSATPPITLSPGVNRFGFTGNFEIDFDAYSVSDASQQVLLGNWSVRSGYPPHAEQQQHFFRVRGNGPFMTVLLPYRKGERPESVRVQQKGNDVIVTFGDTSAHLTARGYAVTRNGATTKRSWGR